MLNKYAPYILAISLFIFGLSLGFFVGKTFFKDTTPMNEAKPETNQLYSSQTATIRGQIVARQGSNLTVENLNNGSKGTIKTTSRVIIAKFNPNTRSVASPSSDLATIDLNKEVLITLELIDGEYQATLIQYVLPTPTLPPLKN